MDTGLTQVTLLILTKEFNKELLTTSNADGIWNVNVDMPKKIFNLPR